MLYFKCVQLALGYYLTRGKRHLHSTHNNNAAGQERYDNCRRYTPSFRLFKLLLFYLVPFSRLIVLLLARPSLPSLAGRVYLSLFSLSVRRDRASIDFCSRAIRAGPSSRYPRSCSPRVHTHSRFYKLTSIITCTYYHPSS